MESDLLRREQEFHKMNSELEQRTNRILQELDAAKSKVGLSHDISPHLANSSTFGCPKSFCLKNDSQQVNSKEEKEKQFLNKEVEDPLAIRSNGLGYEATNRLLRAKLTILNKEVESLRQDYKQKSEECRKMAADLTRSEEEGVRLESLLSAARESSANVQNKLELTSQQLNRTQAENLSLNKELVSVRKELKLQRQQTSAAELRLNRALEDVEKLRNSTKQNQLQIKEDRENQRKILDQLQLKIKGLERQQTELKSVCTKQSHLIDNLRRQKAHMEATQFVHSAEAEFDRILDWCLKNENFDKTNTSQIK